MSGTTTSSWSGTGANPGPYPDDYTYPTQDDYLDEFPDQMANAMERLARHTHPWILEELEKVKRTLDSMAEQLLVVINKRYAVPNSVIVTQEKLPDGVVGFDLPVSNPRRTVVQVMERNERSARCFCYYNRATKKWVIVQLDETIDALQANVGGGGGSGGNAPGKNIADTSGLKIYSVPSGMSNKAYLWRILISNGYSDEQTAGIMGNLRQESGPNYDPTIGTSYKGIVQWGGSRLTELKKFASDNNRKWDAIETQVEFMLREMKGKQNLTKFNDASFRKITSTDTATKVFMDDLEGTAHALDKRQAFARDLFKEMKGTEKWVEGSSGGGSGSTGATSKKEWNERLDAAKAYADGISGRSIGVSLWDSKDNERIGGFRDGDGGGGGTMVKIASMIKAFYLGCFLNTRGEPSGQNASDVRAMIVTSDDPASARIKNVLGASTINSYMRNKLGWSGFSLPGSAPGTMMVNAYQLGRSFSKLPDSLDGGTRGYALNLLSSITSRQQWGLIAAAKEPPKWDWWVKGGWLGYTSSGPTSVSQVGMFDNPAANERIVLAVVQRWSGSGGPDTDTIDDMSTAAARDAVQTLQRIGEIMLGKRKKSGVMTAPQPTGTQAQQPTAGQMSTQIAGNDYTASTIPEGKFRIVYYTLDKHPQVVTPEF